MENFGGWKPVSGEALSNGAFGKVFEVWSYAPGTRVVRRGALKVLLDPNYRESVETLVAEIETYATLNNPHIPRFLETGIDAKGAPWLIVEFIEGKTLLKQVELFGQLDRTEILEAAKQLSQALQEAHSKNLKHLDIKADNIMQRETGDWVLLDFGLSTKQYQRGTGLRNNFFSAPEQFDRRNTITAAADIFSLGVTLYFGLTGKNPYDVYLPISYEEAVQTKGPSLSLAPEEFRELLAVMLHLKPEHRPTASEVSRKISTLMSGSPAMDWHPDRIKSWGMLSVLAATWALKGADFKISLAQAGNVRADIEFNRIDTGWSITFAGESTLGRAITPAGRTALTKSKIRMGRAGNFETVASVTNEELPGLAVEIVRDGLELSLAELSYEILG